MFSDLDEMQDYYKKMGYTSFEEMVNDFVKCIEQLLELPLDEIKETCPWTFRKSKPVRFRCRICRSFMRIPEIACPCDYYGAGAITIAETQIRKWRRSNFMKVELDARPSLNKQLLVEIKINGKTSGYMLGDAQDLFKISSAIEDLNIIKDNEVIRSGKWDVEAEVDKDEDDIIQGYADPYNPPEFDDVLPVIVTEHGLYYCNKASDHSELYDCLVAYTNEAIASCSYGNAWIFPDGFARLIVGMSGEEFADGCEELIVKYNQKVWHTARRPDRKYILPLMEVTSAD